MDSLAIDHTFSPIGTTDPWAKMQRCHKSRTKSRNNPNMIHQARKQEISPGYNDITLHLSFATLAMENVTARQSVWSTIQMKRFLAYDTCLANWESSNMIHGEELSSTTRLCKGRGQKTLNLGSFVCIPKTSHIQQETSNTLVAWISQSHLRVISWHQDFLHFLKVATSVQTNPPSLTSCHSHCTGNDLYSLSMGNPSPVQPEMGC